jgi:hypothetical protein
MQSGNGAVYFDQAPPPNHQSKSPQVRLSLAACGFGMHKGSIENTSPDDQAPGDLAVSLDWPSFYLGRGTGLPCLLKVGVPVTIKNPNPNDGRQRYLRCSDVIRLAEMHEAFVRLGPRQ